MLSTIIIDDQEICREAVSDILLDNFKKQIEVSAMCDSGAEGIKAINRINPQLIFLDVEMPGMTGFEMLKKLKNINFEIVFTTSHEKYSLQAIKHSAFDFLVKPVKSEELIETVERVFVKRNLQYSTRAEVLLDNIGSQAKKNKKVALPVDWGLIFVKIEEIVRCEASNNYTTVILSSGKRHLLSKTLKHVVSMIEDESFFRVHQSHYVNINHIVSYSKSDGGFLMMDDGSEVPVAKARKDEFVNFIK